MMKATTLVHRVGCFRNDHVQSIRCMTLSISTIDIHVWTVAEVDGAK